MRSYLSVVVVSALLAGVSAAPAVAATTINSSSYDLDIDISVLNILGLGVGPLTASAGGAPGAYSTTDSTLTLNQDLDIALLGIGVRQRVNTGLLSTSASSPYTGVAGLNQFGTARAQIDDLATQLGLLGLDFLTPTFSNLLSLRADTIVSRSSVTAPGGVATATGFTSLEGLVVSGSLLGGATIDGSLYVNPDPNFVLFQLGVGSAATVKIILNEQIPTGDGSTSAGISTNAIHIILNGLQLTNGFGVLSGNIIIGHSEARIIDAVEPVPEPATWIQMIAGFGIAGTLMRRRRRPVAA